MKGYKIELAISNKCTCKRCEQKIPLGVRKLIIFEQGYQFPKKSTYCKNCGVNEIKREIKSMQDQIKLLEEDYINQNPKETMIEVGGDEDEKTDY